MKMKATSTVEYEADDNDDRAHYFLEQALKRAQTALKDSIEQGARGAAAATGIRKNSTNIVVVNRLVLLRYKFLRERCPAAAPPQHGQRDKRPTIAMMSLRRMVAIEFGMCRSGRKGGSSGSVTVG